LQLAAVFESAIERKVIAQPPIGDHPVENIVCRGMDGASVRRTNANSRDRVQGSAPNKGGTRASASSG
jgi:hypothetical protein